ncbi:MAG: AAA family ATPase [Elusimicrobia bacterium]|nr:AAA family ATPase [Elusimicrobiota bacterium]
MRGVSISKVIIKRFRSFPSATMTLDNPLFVVGCNGSGKSNLASVFSFVSEAMASPLQAVFDRLGGIAAVRNRSSARSAPANLGLAFEFGPVNGIAGGRFGFEVKALPNHGYKIVREQCLVRKSDGTRWWFDRKETSWESNAKGLTPALEASALSLPLIGGDERFAPIFRILSSMRVYSIEPAKLREMQDPDSGVALRADGGNAASVLQELSRGEEAGEIKEAVNRILETIVPATKSVTPKKHGNKLSMQFSQEWGSDKNKKLTFDAYNMSDGTLRCLGLILAVFQKPSPSLLVIEEPEATIHPGALGAVLDLIRRAAKSMQVVVTTHSPELLDAKWIQDNNLRIVIWKEGASHALMPSQATRKVLKDHLMGAGELLRSNALHGEELFSAEDDLRQGNLFEDLA